MLTLIIGNKNYSSWSLRPWLLLKQAGIPFMEVGIGIHQKNTLAQIARFSPSTRVPAFIDGKTHVWESLAIAEYVAEKYPAKKLWPSDPRARALARAMAHEMHAGFQHLRKALPFNMSRHFDAGPLKPEVKEDLRRVFYLWKFAQENYWKKGRFLFGSFCIADAMFAPVALRLWTYHISLKGQGREYVNTILNLSSIQEWIDAARQEKEKIEELEPPYPQRRFSDK